MMIVYALSTLVAISHLGKKHPRVVTIPRRGDIVNLIIALIFLGWTSYLLLR